ncbi:VanZ family protein [Neptuniibacter sp. QD29_5]|uniref:VanZ family protein n=1 Tax=Neptuniibacter sp. QD29_5 TaxID=3398207 RepID=UPI0039F50977
MNNAFTQKYKNWIWIAFLLAVAALVYGIFRPTPPERIFENSDKVGHFIAFLSVSLLGRLALYKIPSLTYWSSWFVLACSLEFLQEILQPLRHFSAADAFANTIGVFIAMLLSLTLTKKAQQTTSTK